LACPLLAGSYGCGDGEVFAATRDARAPATDDVLLPKSSVSPVHVLVFLKFAISGGFFFLFLDIRARIFCEQGGRGG